MDNSCATSPSPPMQDGQATSASSPGDVYTQRHMSLSTSHKAGTRWTSEEDDLLRNAVAIYGADSQWKKIATCVPGRDNKACRKRWVYSLSPTIHRGRWSATEDEQLRHCVARFGTAWGKIAKQLPGRSDDQCAKRWREKLDPRNRFSEWTPEEEKLLVDAVRAQGNQWHAISRLLPGRPSISCRNKYRSLCRKDPELAAHSTSASASHASVSAQASPHLHASIGGAHSLLRSTSHLGLGAMVSDSWSSPCLSSDAASTPDAFADASTAVTLPQDQGLVPSGLAAAAPSSSSSSSAPLDIGAFMHHFEAAGPRAYSRSSAPSSLALPSMTLPPTPRAVGMELKQAADSSDSVASNPWKIDVRSYFARSTATQGNTSEAATGLGIDVPMPQQPTPSTSASGMMREDTSSTTMYRPLSPSPVSFLKAQPHADEFFTSPAFSACSSTSFNDAADHIPSPTLTTIEEETQDRTHEPDTVANYAYSLSTSSACTQAPPAASVDGMMTIRSGGLGLYFPSALLEDPSAAVPASNFEMDLDLDVDLDCPLPDCAERRPSLVDLIGHLVAHVATPLDQAGLSQTGVQ